MGAPSLLYGQGPQLTGGGSAAQFCLIGQLEGRWSAVWGKAHGARCPPALGCLLVERPRGRRAELPVQEVGASRMDGFVMGGRCHTHPYQATDPGSGSGSPIGAEQASTRRLAGGPCPSPVGPESCPRAPAPCTSGCQPGERGVEGREPCPRHASP